MSAEKDIEIEEAPFWNTILEFGNENEVVLKAALDDIRGFVTKSNLSKTVFHKTIEIKSVSKKFEKEMYLENNTFE